MSSASDTTESNHTARPLRVFVAGATGYIGKHTVRELLSRGHEVISFAREQSGVSRKADAEQTKRDLNGSEVRFGDICEPDSIRQQGLRDEHFDCVISCLASRTGGIKDALKIDYQANLNLLEACKKTGIQQFVLLSAICVQRPILGFQHAKLKFEAALMNSGINYSIVRPTAFFKSLSGQIKAVKEGKPFTVFGDGKLTACKPISERDLARFIADCLTDPTKNNRILPVGGPGQAITPEQQGHLLFELCQREPKFRHVPVALFTIILAVLKPLSWLPTIKDKMEFARIGRYYATESMLVLNPDTQAYDAEATPSYGNDTLHDFYSHAVEHGLAGQELGDHAMF